MKHLILSIIVFSLMVLSLLAGAALSAAPDKETLTGIITDDMCARADHS